MDDFIGWYWLTADGVVMLEEVGDSCRPGEGEIWIPLERLLCFHCILTPKMCCTRRWAGDKKRGLEKGRTAQLKVRGDGQVPPPSGTQGLFGSCCSSTGFKKRPIHVLQEQKCLHLVLLFSIHNRPLPWLTLDNIIYSIRCKNDCKKCQGTDGAKSLFVNNLKQKKK